jgi:hypothetical protein
MESMDMLRCGLVESPGTMEWGSELALIGDHWRGEIPQPRRDDWVYEDGTLARTQAPRTVIIDWMDLTSVSSKVCRRGDTSGMERGVRPGFRGARGGHEVAVPRFFVPQRVNPALGPGAPHGVGGQMCGPAHGRSSKEGSYGEPKSWKCVCGGTTREEDSSGREASRLWSTVSLSSLPVPATRGQREESSRESSAWRQASSGLRKEL